MPETLSRVFPDLSIASMVLAKSGVRLSAMMRSISCLPSLMAALNAGR